MYAISLGFTAGMNISEVKQFAKPEYDLKKMLEIRNAILDKKAYGV